MGGGECSGGDGGVANASFGIRVGIGGVVKPGAFIDEALEASGPLEAELVDVVGAHLVDDQKDDEFRFRSQLGRTGTRRRLSADERHERADQRKQSGESKGVLRGIY